MKKQFKYVLKTVKKRVLYSTFLVISVLFLLEIAYRLQIVEFYRPALEALNEDNCLSESDSKSKRLLIIGDSFSAQPQSYVKELRTQHPEWCIINAGISGTGIRQHELILEKRLKHFKPDMILYQFYVGNDFTDIKHPRNSDSLSLIRNIYWWLSDRLLVLPFINQRLAYLRNGKRDSPDLRPNTLSFSPSSYTPRVKLYLKANPSAIKQTVSFQPAMQQHYQIWNSKMKKMLEKVPGETPVYVLLIPHCTQVTNQYQEQYKALGAILSDDMLSPEYPLIRQIRSDFPELNLLNPLSYLQQAASPDSLYYQNDPHFTAYGQQLLGQFMQKHFP